jgi:hypothetical protein
VSKFPEQRISGFAVKSSEILPEHPLVEDVAPILKREAMALIKRTQPLTVRKSASRILARMLGLLGLKAENARLKKLVARAQSRD